MPATVPITTNRARMPSIIIMKTSSQNVNLSQPSVKKGGAKAANTTSISRSDLSDPFLYYGLKFTRISYGTITGIEISSRNILD